jgi:WxcM-like, C-terminal
VEIVQGATLFDLKINEDHRGILAAFDDLTNLPFPLKRFFFIRVPAGNAVRGEHASSGHQLIVIACGEMTADLDNGSNRATVVVKPGKMALHLMPGVWLRMRAFEPGTVIVVAASQTFAETRYFSTPQPFASAS